jgi:hypothetical protein
MRTFILTLSCACLAAGCATDAGVQPASQVSTPSPTSSTSTSAPAGRRPVAFSDLPSFDRELAQSLSGAKDPVVVMSADRIPLRQMPPRLEKWLAAVDDSGGKIDTHSLDPAEPQTRSIGLIFTLIGAIRQAREFAKQQQYAEARNFDAKIFYRLDASGDRVMDRLELIRRQR